MTDGDEVEDVFDLGEDTEADQDPPETDLDTGPEDDRSDFDRAEQRGSAQRGTDSDQQTRAERAADRGRGVTSNQARGTTQYALPETWEDLKDFYDLEVQRELRDRGIRDATENEISDAAKVVIQEFPEKVADQVVDRRLEDEER